MMPFNQPLAEVRQSSRESNPLLRVGYIMTHYPRLAQTFIAGEIDAVEQAGLDISCFSMNQPSSSEMVTPGAACRRARTVYLKDRAIKALFDVLILAIRHPIGLARIAAAAIASGGGDIRRTMRRIAHFGQAARLARIGQHRNLSHLHAHFGLAPTTIAWLASRMMSLGERRVGFSFTIHGFHDFADADEARLDLKTAAADAVVCISDFTCSQLSLVTNPVFWQRFHVIRCGIDLKEWEFSPSRKRSQVPMIVAIGRLSAEKGFSVLLKALVNLRQRGSTARLRLIGEGPERVALEAEIQALGLSGLVQLVGELPPDRVRDEIYAADIFCLPSFSEGLPVSIMEAMAAGIPVVTTWIAGIPELAEGGVTALTVPPARPDALADALGRIIQDPSFASQLVRAARLRVEDLHDHNVTGPMMAGLLGKLAT